MTFFVRTERDTIMGQNAYGYFYEIEELAIIARPPAALDHARRGCRRRSPPIYAVIPRRTTVHCR